MAGQNLFQVIEVAIAGEAVLVVPHSLRDAYGQAVVPHRIISDRIAPLVISAVNSANFTVTNATADPQTAKFLLERYHTILADPATAGIYYEGIYQTPF